MPDDIPNQLVQHIANLTSDEAHQARLDEYAKLWTNASVEDLIKRKAQQKINIQTDAIEITFLRDRIRLMRPQDYSNKQCFDDDLQEKQVRLEILEKRVKLAETIFLKCEELLI